MLEVMQKIEELGILPAITPPTLDKTEPLVEAMCAGGLPVMEITLRVPWALETIRLIHKQYPQVLLGAGTVLNVQQALEAIQAGASFIVSPGLDENVVKLCRERGIDVIPGCSNPTEITRALNLGVTTVKFFPAEALGGVSILKDLHGPFADVRFIPTGGLNLNNIAAYLDKPYIAAVGGGFPVPKEQVNAGNWEAVAETCRKAMDISLGLEFSHLGINYANEPEAMAGAEALTRLFRIPQERNKPNSVFSSSSIEHMKAPANGVHGHIGFKARSVKRALAWYRANGVAIREDSLKVDEKGNLTFFYLQEEIGGFAVHVTNS